MDGASLEITQQSLYLHISVGPTILRSLLKIERIVFICLIGGSSDQLIEDRRIILDTGAKQDHFKDKLGGKENITILKHTYK